MADRTTSEALVLLGLERPRVSGKAQEDVDTKLQEWKNTILKKAFKERAHETHPDKHPEDPEAGAKFLAIKEAYEQLVDLRVNLKRPVVACPQGHDRAPSTAKFCHECGYSYDDDALVARLKAAGIVQGTIDAIRANGELAEMQAMNPYSPALLQKFQLLFQRQRLGLVGPYSNWHGR